MLAYLPDDELRRRLAKAPNAIDRDVIAQFREQGYATSRGEVIEGIHALGAPVFDPAGDLVAVVAVATITEVETQADKVKAAAAEITQSLQL